jgi:hypothetical protein
MSWPLWFASVVPNALPSLLGQETQSRQVSNGKGIATRMNNKRAQGENGFLGRLWDILL